MQGRDEMRKIETRAGVPTKGQPCPYSGGESYNTLSADHVDKEAVVLDVKGSRQAGGKAGKYCMMWVHRPRRFVCDVGTCEGQGEVCVLGSHGWACKSGVEV
jgi:hypothetical protein